jgi:hydroxymethylpyrimidine/phosphomethylpyrimidine kinase
MKESAVELGKIYQTNILIKGGHLEAIHAIDILYSRAENKCYTLSAERIETKNTHGTGCTLSSAIATYLACGKNLLDAVQAAKDYLTAAIRAGAEQTVGRGHGPVNHFYFIGEK